MIENLVLVDENDKSLGLEEKWNCHKGQGRLHRAFSLWIFRTDGKVLLQQRSKQKLLWPEYWSNSCCSHPRENESYENATIRRTQEELGLIIEPKLLTKFQYQSNYAPNGKLIGSENEVCALLYAMTNKNPTPNPEEIKLTKYLNIQEIIEQVGLHPELYTPWFKIELKEIQKYKIK